MATTNDTSKLPKWARDLLTAKEREIARLTKALETARVEVAGHYPNPVGHILLGGYDSEPLPLGRHFRLQITTGEGAGVDVCLESHGALTAYVTEGYVAAVPAASNVMHLRRLTSR